jgi:ABC-type oligopeptide transport system ATPase subunit
MTTSDAAHATGEALTPTATGHVEPKIRGRLRNRLPSHIRTARGQLFVLAGYLLLAPISVGILAISGSLAKMNISSQDLVGATVGNLVFVGLCLLSSRLLLRRSLFGYVLAVGVAGFVAVLGSWAIYRVISGDQGLSGDPGFFFVIYQGVHVVLGAAIVYNLLREVGSVRQIVSEADRTGDTLEVELRDIRVKPGTAVAAAVEAGELTEVDLVAAVEAGELSVEEAAAATAAATGVAAVAIPSTAPPVIARHESGVEPLLAVRDLKKHFPIVGGLLRRQIGTVYAVDGVSFDVYPGEIFSLVGESGCGKTTLGRTVLQLTPPTAGKVVFDGYELADVDPEDMRPLRRRMQIIFQDPFGSLNPRMPVLDIIGEGLLAQGVTDRKTRDTRVEDSLEIVGLRRDYTRRYPHEFSGGQRQRIGIARALALGPDLIVCDEPVSALDVSIQSQVLNLLLDLRRDFNLTYLFISHNLSVVQYFSDRVGVMYLGKLVEEGAVEQLYRNPRHPYTVALLSAIPDADPRRRKKRLVLKGDVPSPAAPPSAPASAAIGRPNWLTSPMTKSAPRSTGAAAFIIFSNPSGRNARATPTPIFSI